MLGIIRGSVVTAVCDETGDDSPDSRVKIRRIINRRGRSFCKITDWPFLRKDITFNIAGNTYKYTGAGYLPANFKEVLGAYLLDSNTRYPLTEVGVKEAYEWENPLDNQDIPDKFCIMQLTRGFWEIWFNRVPDNTYSIFMEISQEWLDIDESSAGDTTQLIISDDYLDAFTLYCTIARFRQQGDADNYQLTKDEWFNPLKPQDSILNKILADLSSPLRQKAVQMDMRQAGNIVEDDHNDYHKNPDL